MIKNLVFALLLLNLGWTLALYFEPSHTTFFNYFYNLSYGLNFALAAWFCGHTAKHNPSLSPTLKYFTFGFISFSLAQAVWLTYNLVLHSPVPYPGWADLFWLLFYPLLIIGFIKFLRSLGSPLTPGNTLEIIVISAMIFLLISSFLSLNNSQLGLPLLTQLLNYLYPIFDALLIALSITTLRTQVGRLNFYILYFVLGFVTLALGDTLFAYQTTLETYWNGNLVDLIYALSGYLLLMGVLSLPKISLSSTSTASSNSVPSAPLVAP